MIKLKTLLLENDDQNIIVGVILKSTHKIIASDKVGEHYDLREKFPIIAGTTNLAWRYNKKLKTLFFWETNVDSKYIDDVKSYLKEHRYIVNKIVNIGSYDLGTHKLDTALYLSHGEKYFPKPKNFSSNSPCLAENLKSDAHITIDDIIEKIDKAYSSRSKIHLNILEDWYYSTNPEESQWVKDYIELLNKIYDIGKAIAAKHHIPHFSYSDFKDYLLSQEDFSMDINTFFPIPLYVSASPNDDMTVGILFDINGKPLEIHEGGDETSIETNTLVNNLMNPNGKPVRIYSAQNTKLVFTIDETEYLPENLYVSPKKSYAAGYLDLKGERSLFTGIININDVAIESDVDWRTLHKTKIKNFQWL